MERTELKNRLFFSAQDVANTYGLTLPSAYVLCSRYVRRGTFIRLKRDLYVLERNWERYGQWEFFQLCNFLQVPSYVSCITALSYHGITTQVQRDWYENMTQRRSIRTEVQGISFLYHKLQPQHYFGFMKRDGFFIALPEKAFLDAVYLESLGRYPLDWSSLNLEHLDSQQLVALMEPFPERVKRRVRRECRV